MPTLSPFAKTTLGLIAPASIILTVWTIQRSSEASLRAEFSAKWTEMRAEFEKAQCPCRPPGPQVSALCTVHDQSQQGGPHRLARAANPAAPVLQARSSTRSDQDRARSAIRPSPSSGDKTPKATATNQGLSSDDQVRDCRQALPSALQKAKTMDDLVGAFQCDPDNPEYRGLARMIRTYQIESGNEQLERIRRELVAAYSWPIGRLSKP